MRDQHIGDMKHEQTLAHSAENLMINLNNLIDAPGLCIQRKSIIQNVVFRDFSFAQPDTVIKTTGILNKPLPFHHFLRKGLLPENWIGDDLNLHRKMDFLCVDRAQSLFLQNLIGFAQFIDFTLIRLV